MNQSDDVRRSFKGIWIPRELYLTKTLNWTEKLLLIEIDSLSTEKGCFASNAYFAKMLGIDVKYVSQKISKLVKLGLVKVEGVSQRRVLRSSVGILYEQPSTVTEPISKAALKDEPKTAISIVLPFTHNTEAFKQAFIDYAEMRKKIKKPMTQSTQERVMRKLERHTVETAIAMLEKATDKNWLDVYELNNNGLRTNTTQPDPNHFDGTIRHGVR